jgi:hypothetical protein
MKHRALAIIAVGALVAVGCSATSDSLTESCRKAAIPYAGSVVGAFRTTAGAARALRGGATGAELWPGVSPDHEAALCYVDAEIAKAPPPAPGATTSPEFDRAVFAVVDGQPVLIVAGYRDDLPVMPLDP